MASPDVFAARREAAQRPCDDCGSIKKCANERLSCLIFNMWAAGYPGPDSGRTAAEAKKYETALEIRSFWIPSRELYRAMTRNERINVDPASAVGRYKIVLFRDGVIESEKIMWCTRAAAIIEGRRIARTRDLMYAVMVHNKKEWIKMKIPERYKCARRI